MNLLPVLPVVMIEVIGSVARMVLVSKLVSFNRCSTDPGDTIL
jgi:hypothetical protein